MIRRRIQTVTNGGDADGEQQAGKDSRGRFCRGNKFGRGNAYSLMQSRIQTAIRAQLDGESLRAFVADWIKHARSGKGVYLISLLERLAGRPAEWAVEERIAALEAQIIAGTGQPQAST